MSLLKLACALAPCISAALVPLRREAAEREPLVLVERATCSGGELLFARSRCAFPITIAIELVAAENARASWEGAGRGVVVPARGTALLGRIEPERADEPWSYRWRERWWAGSRDATPDPEIAYRSPLARDARVLQGFHGAESHRGSETYAVDLACPLGTEVLAARAGVVVDLRADGARGGADPALRSEANFVRVLHADGTLGFYAHFAREGVEVRLDQRVEAGARLGRTGLSGWMGEPHLHFAVAVADVRDGWRSVPFRFARKGTDSEEPRAGEILRGARGTR
jgi:murein DD-endopeptidase MepM/ murein hydrolase activator NlpD